MDSTGCEDYASTDPMENKKILLVEMFLKKSKIHVDGVFQSWRTSGETYMIPPDPVTVSLGPGDNETSFSGKIAAKKQSNMKGDWAEAKVHTFLSKSRQHAFIMQKFDTSRWRRIFETLLDGSKSFDDEFKKIANIEIDFLILHAFLGVVAIEVKAVEIFQKRRYTDSKKQLDKVDILLENILKILAVIEKQSNSIPVSKVVSFPNVKMKQDVKKPYNLGQINLELQPELWWDNLLEGIGTKHNRFAMEPIYHDAVIFLLGVYSIAASAKIKAKCIQKSKFFVPTLALNRSDDRGSSSRPLPAIVGSRAQALPEPTSMSIEDMDPCPHPPYFYDEISMQTVEVMKPRATLYKNSPDPPVLSSLPFPATTMGGVSDSCSLAIAENFFFLNFGQLQVMNCPAKKQLIMGEARTGKTVALQEKAFDLLMRGESVSFLIPRNLQQVYQCFEGNVDHKGNSKIYYHETIFLETLKKLRNSIVFIDDLQNFSPITANFLDRKELPEDFRCHEQKFNCTMFDIIKFLRKVAKAVVALSPAYSFGFPTEHYPQQLLNSDFQLIQLHHQCVNEPN